MAADDRYQAGSRTERSRLTNTPPRTDWLSLSQNGCPVGVSQPRMSTWLWEVRPSENSDIPSVPP